MKSALTVSLVVPLLGVVLLGAATAQDRPDAARPGAGAAKPAAKGGPGKGGTKPVVGGKRVVKIGGEARAWSTLRPLLPESVVFAGQVNVAAVRGSDTFRSMRRVAEKQSDLRVTLDAVKADCQIDLGEALQDAAFALADSSDDLLVALSFKGVGEADLLRCAEALVQQKLGGKSAKLESRRIGSGPIVEYGLVGSKDRLYVAWLAPDVVAFIPGSEERTELEKMLAGKGSFAAAPGTRRAVAAVAAGAAAWAIYVKHEQLDAYQLQLASGSLGVGGGQLSLDVSLFMVDADSAKRAAAEWIVQRDQLAASGSSSPLIGPLVKAIQIVATDEVVRLSATVSEKDLSGFFSLF